MGLLTVPRAAELSWLAWLAIAAILIITGCFKLARERLRRQTIVAVMRAVDGCILVMDRDKRGRMLMVVKLCDDHDEHVDIVPALRNQQ